MVIKITHVEELYVNLLKLNERKKCVYCVHVLIFWNIYDFERLLNFNKYCK